MKYAANSGSSYTTFRYAAQDRSASRCIGRRDSLPLTAPPFLFADLTLSLTPPKPNQIRPPVYQNNRTQFRISPPNKQSVKKYQVHPSYKSPLGSSFLHTNKNIKKYKNNDDNNNKVGYGVDDHPIHIRATPQPGGFVGHVPM